MKRFSKHASGSDEKKKNCLQLIHSFFFSSYPQASGFSFLFSFVMRIFQYEISLKISRKGKLNGSLQI
jgi:hypothetical protein